MKQNRARNQQDKENRRNLILDTAVELYLTSSGELPNANLIAKESNMTKGNLYTYFESKETLFYELLIQQYSNWFDQALKLPDYSFSLQTRLFEGFYNNELLVRLCSLYQSNLKFHLNKDQKEKLQRMIKENIEQLATFIYKESKSSKSKIQTLLYSSISLIIGALHFEYEFEYDYNSISPEDIYLPRLKAMWDSI